jgi:hypothetical protein
MNNMRSEASRHIRIKEREYLKAKINEPTAYNKNNNR